MSDSESKAISKTKRFGAAWEVAAPWVYGVVAGIGFWWWNPPTDRVAQAVARFLDGSIAAAAVLSGFQVTALSLLLAISDRPIVGRLRQLGFYQKLIAYHWHAIIAMFIWLLGSLLLLLMQGGTCDSNGNAVDLGQFTRWSSIVILVAMISAICASYRVTHLLVKMLSKHS